MNVHEQSGDQERDAEERHDPGRAGRDVSHHLGEPDDVQVHVDVHAGARGGVATDAFELAGDVDVVEPFPGVGVNLLQLCRDDRAGEVVRHQAADDSGLDDVLSHARETRLRRLEVRRQHVSGPQRHLPPLR